MFYSTAQTEIEIADDFWFELNRGHLDMDLQEDLQLTLESEFLTASEDDLLEYWKEYTNEMINHYRSSRI
jgi:hypothetical protein